MGGKVVISTATDSIQKITNCESCKAIFSYVMERTGSGSAGSFPLDLRDTGARAQRLADDDVAARLAKEVDPVRCPHCNVIQAEMRAKVIRDARNESLTTWTPHLVGGMFLTFLFGLATPAAAVGSESAATTAIYAVLLVAGVALVGWHFYSRLRALPDEKTLLAGVARVGKLLASPDKFRFLCSTCRQGVIAKREHAGKKAKCQTCGTIVDIPRV